MIQEDYVPYYIAKLLDCKGFEGVCDYAYNNKGNYFEIDRRNFDEVYCLRPTYQMAMKWIREVHKLFIEIHIEQGEKVSYKFMIWDFYIIHPNEYVGGTYDFREERKGFSTPEQAIEEALKYSLENLI